MAGPYDHFVGELTPGSQGWLPLDSDGTPCAPATFACPEPNSVADACSVICNVNTPLPANQDLLMTSSGAPITDHMTSNIEKRVYSSDSVSEPVIDSMSPNSAPIGSPDFALVITGDNFGDSPVINFAGQDEPTTLNEDGSVSTTVKPSLWLNPDIVQVFVKSNGVQSGPLAFEFTSSRRA